MMDYLAPYCDWATGVQGPEASMARQFNSWLQKRQDIFENKLKF
jgi:hypothetical protein